MTTYQRRGLLTVLLAPGSSACAQGAAAARAQRGDDPASPRASSTARRCTRDGPCACRAIAFRRPGPAASVCRAGCHGRRPAGTTLMPGLIEGHSHVLLHPYNETSWNDQVLHESLGVRTARAVNHLRATLMAGFTTMRDLGTEGAGYADVELKQAVEQGIIPGPRMLVATRAIVATGSYGPKGFCARVARAAGRRGGRRRRRSFASCAIRSDTAPTGSRSTPTIVGARAAKRRPTFSIAGADRDRRDRPEQRAPGGRARDDGRGHAPRRSWPAWKRSSTATAARRKCSS